MTQKIDLSFGFEKNFFEKKKVAGTPPRGNTKSRGWCLTFFEEKWIEEFKDWSNDSRYALIGNKELTLEKKEHWHAFVYYDNPRAWNPIHERFPGVHLEPCNKNLNYMKYCCKEGKLWDEGDPPKANIDIENMSEEEIIRADPRCHKAYIEAKRKLDGIKLKNDVLNEIRREELKSAKCFVFQGGTGKGKTYGACMKAIDLKYKNDDIGFIDFDEKFITGEVDKKCLICKEFRPSQIRPWILLELLDKYGINARVLGSSLFVRPEVVMLCSIVRVEDYYKNEEINKQFTRRIEIIDLGYDEEKVKLGEADKLLRRI